MGGRGYTGGAVFAGCGQTVNGERIADHNHCTMQFGNMPTAWKENGENFAGRGLVYAEVHIPSDCNWAFTPFAQSPD
jgi:hypothetical protein